MTIRVICGVLLSVCLLLAVATGGAAQPQQGCNQQKKWNYDGTELFWEWGAIVDPPPTGFRVKVGTVKDVYTVTKDVPATQFSIPFSVLTAGPGTFYAVVVPMYGTKEGVTSESCFFDSGRAVVNLGVRKSP